MENPTLSVIRSSSHVGEGEFWDMGLRPMTLLSVSVGVDNIPTGIYLWKN